MLGYSAPRFVRGCPVVPTQAQNSPQSPVRAGGLGEGQSSGLKPINAKESTVYRRDAGGPPFTLSPEIAGSEPPVRGRRL